MCCWWRGDHSRIDLLKLPKNVKTNRVIGYRIQARQGEKKKGETWGYNRWGEGWGGKLGAAVRLKGGGEEEPSYWSMKNAGGLASGREDELREKEKRGGSRPSL